MPGFPSSDLRLKQGQKLITSPVLLVAFLKINISGVEKALGLYFISYKCVWGGGAERQTDRQEGGGRLRFCTSHWLSVSGFYFPVL